MHKIIITLIVLLFSCSVFAQISDHPYDVSMYSDFNYSAFEKNLKSFRSNLEIPFILIGADVSGQIGSYGEQMDSLAAQLSLNRLRLGALGVSFDGLFDFSKAGEHISLDENFFNNPNYRLDTSITILDAFEVGFQNYDGYKTSRFSFEFNLLDLSNLLPTDLKKEYSFLTTFRNLNMLTFEDGLVNATSNTILLPIPYLKSISLNTFLSDELYFLQPSVLVWMGFTPLWIIPEWEINSINLVSFEIGFDPIAASSYKMITLNESNKGMSRNEFREYYESVTNGFGGNGVSSDGFAGTFYSSFYLEYNAYDPYYSLSLSEGDQTIGFGFQIAGNQFNYDDRSIQSYMKAGSTYDESKGIRRLAMSTSARAQIDLGLDHDWALDVDYWALKFEYHISFGSVLTSRDPDFRYDY